MDIFDVLTAISRKKIAFMKDTAISKMWGDSYLKLYNPWLGYRGELFLKAVELSKDASPQKYQGFYEEWIKSCQNTCDYFHEIHNVESSREAFEKLLASAENSNKIYRPWINSMMKLSAKSIEISRGNANPEAYKEYYTLWQNTYKDTYGKLFDIQSMLPSKEAFENFARNASVNLSVSNSWIDILEKLSQKVKELSKQNADPETYKECYNLWAKIYEKAFENFFENFPTVSPFREIFEPVKNASKIYADTFTSISSNLIKSHPISAIVV